MSRLSLSHRFGRFLDYLLPPLCLSCNEPVGVSQTLCVDCWKAIQFFSPPFCSCCGAPFEVPVESGTLCGACLASPPEFTAARAAMLYNEGSKKLILGFKHADKVHPAPALANWMLRAGQDFWSEADFILPVPLHRWRLLMRRYNQAALLAHEIGKAARKPVLTNALKRIRSTPSQGHMNKEQRKKNIHGAIKLNPNYAAKIKDRAIVLIDDVMTTGATANECSRVLLRAGAAKVFVLTLARTRIAD
jgi:ComF family protein